MVWLRSLTLLYVVAATRATTSSIEVDAASGNLAINAAAGTLVVVGEHFELNPEDGFIASPQFAKLADCCGKTDPAFAILVNNLVTKVDELSEEHTKLKQELVDTTKKLTDAHTKLKQELVDTKSELSDNQKELADAQTKLKQDLDSTSSAVADIEQDLESSCVIKKFCKAGEYTKSPCSKTTKHTCAACPDGTFSADGSASACAQHAACSPGEFVAKTASLSADTACTACANGQFSKTANAAACTTCTAACEEGHVVSSECSSVADLGCKEEGLIGYWPFDKHYSNVCSGKGSSLAARPLWPPGDHGGGKNTRSSTNGHAGGGAYYERVNQNGFDSGLVVPTTLKAPTSTFSASFWFTETGMSCHSPGDCAGIIWFSPRGNRQAHANFGEFDNLIGRGGLGNQNQMVWWQPTGSGKEMGHTLVAGVWHHYTLVSDDTAGDAGRADHREKYSVKMYVDGILLSTLGVYKLGDCHPSDHLKYELGTSMRIMNYEGNNNQHYATGKMDELAIWNRALTPEEVLTNYKITSGQGGSKAAPGNHLKSDKCPWNQPY